jgi:hypothetical protein
MKKINLLILVAPFLIMVLVNETCRVFDESESENFTYSGITAMNSSLKKTNECTWACHNSTKGFCMEKHRKYIKDGFPFYAKINDFYFGIIDFNHQKVNGKKVRNPSYYVFMNVILLVFLWPLIMYLMMINSLRLMLKNKN